MESLLLLQLSKECRAEEYCEIDVKIPCSRACRWENCFIFIPDNVEKHPDSANYHDEDSLYNKLLHWVGHHHFYWQTFLNFISPSCFCFCHPQCWRTLQKWEALVKVIFSSIRNCTTRATRTHNFQVLNISFHHDRVHLTWQGTGYTCLNLSVYLSIRYLYCWFIKFSLLTNSLAY